MDALHVVILTAQRQGELINKIQEWPCRCCLVRCLGIIGAGTCTAISGLEIFRVFEMRIFGKLGFSCSPSPGMYPALMRRRGAAIDHLSAFISYSYGGFLQLCNSPMWHCHSTASQHACRAIVSGLSLTETIYHYSASSLIRGAG